MDMVAGEWGMGNKYQQEEVFYIAMAECVILFLSFQPDFTGCVRE